MPQQWNHNVQGGSTSEEDDYEILPLPPGAKTPPVAGGGVRDGGAAAVQVVGGVGGGRQEGRGVTSARECTCGLVGHHILREKYREYEKYSHIVPV